MARKVTVYLPEELHRQAKVAAAQLDKTLSAIVLEALREWLERRAQNGGQKRE